MNSHIIRIKKNTIYIYIYIYIYTYIYIYIYIYIPLSNCMIMLSFGESTLDDVQTS